MRVVVLLPALMLLIAGCATTGGGSSSEEPSPPGTPEAIMDLLRGDKPKPKVDVAKMEKHPLGSKENPVRVGGPMGERAYLARLRCEDGRYPEFERVGSFDIGPWGYILDGYDVVCPSGQKAFVFMDMYHSQHLEDRAVPGFTIEPRAPN